MVTARMVEVARVSPRSQQIIHDFEHTSPRLLSVTGYASLAEAVTGHIDLGQPGSTMLAECNTMPEATSISEDSEREYQ
jgi:hypothetical protein